MSRSSWRVVAVAVGSSLVASSGLFVAGTAPAAIAQPNEGRGATALRTDTKSRLTVQPPAYGKRVVVFASFSKPHALRNRPVTLERKAAGSTWRKVKSARMNAKGQVEIHLTGSASAQYDRYTYRAIATRYAVGKRTRGSVTTRSVRAGSQWVRTFDDQFSGRTIDPNKWTTRQDGALYGLRLCSAPTPANVAVKGGKLHLAMKKAKDKTFITRANRSARAAQKSARSAALRQAKSALVKAKAKQRKARTSTAKRAAAAARKKAENALRAARAMKVNGCSHGVYTNAAIGTAGKFSVKSGLVSTRIKFPRGQGMHGAAWLKANNSGHELDFIESYGYGKGVSTVVHVPVGGKLVRIPGTPDAAYVARSLVKRSSWWNDYHVFSMEWNAKQMIFRIDGQVTRTITRTTGSHPYHVVLSLLSSDWELPLLRNPDKRSPGVKKTKLPSSMVVDWIRVWERA